MLNIKVKRGIAARKISELIMELLRAKKKKNGFAFFELRQPLRAVLPTHMI